uniref:ATP phosphoribosyltransferase n=1 Tax=Streptomyces candidus TaxID=67283 RepID=A0A646SKQ5_9ACTN|nr:ATP phosphoribosyltransferase [Streptomyces candidus]
MVTLVLPTGSLHEPTLRLFDAAGLTVHRQASRALRAHVDFPGIERVVFGKPREIPGLVADGVVDLGLTGTDWIEESGAKVEVVHEFQYSKTTSAGWRVVLAVPVDHPARTAADLPAGVRVASEYPAIARRYFEEELGQEARIVHSHGSTEAKVPDLADAVLEIVETGDTLRHNDLRELVVVRRCAVQLVVATQADPVVRATAEKVALLLKGARAATEHALLTVVAPADCWDRVRQELPRYWWLLGGDPETVVAQATYELRGVAEAITRLTQAGAVQVVETPMRKLVTA